MTGVVNYVYLVFTYSTLHITYYIKLLHINILHIYLFQNSPIGYLSLSDRILFLGGERGLVLIVPQNFGVIGSDGYLSKYYLLACFLFVSDMKFILLATLTIE